MVSFFLPTSVTCFRLGVVPALCLELMLHVRAYFSLASHKLPHFNDFCIKGAMPIWTHLASHISSHRHNDTWYRNAPSALGSELSRCSHHLQRLKGTQIFAYREQWVSLCGLVICCSHTRRSNCSGGLTV